MFHTEKINPVIKTRSNKLGSVTAFVDNVLGFPDATGVTEDAAIANLRKAIGEYNKLEQDIAMDIDKKLFWGHKNL